MRVRQAINYAFDRENLLAQLAAGQGELTSQVFGPDSTAYLPELDEYYTYDPDKAVSVEPQVQMAVPSIYNYSPAS